MIKKGDILIIALLCIICILLFIPSFISSGSKTAVIYLDGEVQHEIDLSKTEKEYTLEVGGCTLTVDSDGVTFAKSTCPDKLCVKKGRLHESGDTMACVPNKVVVTVKSSGKSQFDAVAY
ncbi:MAG: NusG domain II-containing protein [Faecalibacterium sp.]|nr:NusG domain II-containing protein [Ruminococcus sp.]MCM1392323.1 NusG domain II-containing protein [Ruminococcus sp.]MCM1486052.1 NusG domain II-containing protein [Faecalibacterium sp.]